MRKQDERLMLELEKQLRKHQELKSKLLLNLEFENSQIGIIQRNIDEVGKWE
jgi:hypothetical protein